MFDRSIRRKIILCSRSNNTLNSFHWIKNKVIVYINYFINASAAVLKRFIETTTWPMSRKQGDFCSPVVYSLSSWDYLKDSDKFIEMFD